MASTRIENRLGDLLRWRLTNDDNLRPRRHLRNRREATFNYLTHSGLDATNWRAEQAIRGAVVNR